MKYTVNLNVKELSKLAEDLNKYADSFEEKVKTFLDKLADLAISVASVNEGDFSGYIVYSKEFGGGNSIKIMAKDSQVITNSWYAGSKSKELRQETISPLLMAEFGSGHYAISEAGIGGQGTLNEYGHAFDSNGWYWWTDDVTQVTSGDAMISAANGRWKFHSYGTPPSRPLHNAVMACINEVEEIAREVFR